MTGNLPRKTFMYLVVIFCFVVNGCEKNRTHYYPDKEIPGVSIFSNTSNNVFSCFINGQPWKTIASTSAGFISSTIYEVAIYLHRSSALMDTLSIVWLGDGYQKNNVASISLTLPVAKNFNLKALSALQGKRLIIDSTNGFFAANNGYYGTTNTSPRGKGNIYFNTIQFDSTAANGYYGKISGLMEATIDLLTITSGRFDDSIGPEQITGY
ncbi:MAG: hypothetical protein ABJB86_16245 [Bacteroidota bacterium]